MGPSNFPISAGATSIHSARSHKRSKYIDARRIARARTHTYNNARMRIYICGDLHVVARFNLILLIISEIIRGYQWSIVRCARMYLCVYTHFSHTSSHICVHYTHTHNTYDAKRVYMFAHPEVWSVNGGGLCQDEMGGRSINNLISPLVSVLND